MAQPRLDSGSVPLEASDEEFREDARRRSQRECSHADVEFLSPVTAEGVALNISEGGLRVAVYDEIPADAECLVKVRLEDDRQVERQARVVWSRKVADGWVLGLEFKDRDPDATIVPDGDDSCE
jgi:hypothetical protein